MFFTKNILIKAKIQQKIHITQTFRRKYLKLIKYVVCVLVFETTYTYNTDYN